MCFGNNAADSKAAFKAIIKYLDSANLSKAVEIWNNDIKIAFNESQTFEDIFFSITTLLKKVKNPDKETVLTPEKVVDLHYSKANID
jgi:hypothetical protein